MSGKVKSALLLLALTAAGAAGVHAKGLPIVDVVGNKYYVYEVKKGDSVFGIAKSNGWDVAELERLNPKTVGNLKKGDKLYYPLERGVKVVPDEIPESVAEKYIEPIVHVVKRGESVYSIAGMYGIPVEQIYAAHPSARHGIRVGEEIELRQPEQKADGELYYIYYNVRPGDTLFSVARRFQTSVAALMKANPGVSEKNFESGSRIRVQVGKDTRRHVTQQIEEENLASIENYKVEKDDTWDTISQKTCVSRERLLESNGSWHKLEKNEIIIVPRTDTLVYERDVVFEDPREQSSEGLADIYEESNKIVTNPEQRREIDLAYVMMDPASNRDIEFSRGVLTGIDTFRGSGYKIRFKIFDGTQNSVNVIDSLSSATYDLIFSTSEKGIPSYLAEYAEVSQTPLVNVFDARNQVYASNPYVMQYLTPSDVFNKKTRDYIVDNFNGTRVICVGSDDSEDESSLMADLRSGMTESPVLTLTLEEFADFPFDADRYLICGNVSKKSDISRLLDIVRKGTEDEPGANVTVFGRPGWMVYEESLLDKNLPCEVLLPARFRFDKDDMESRSFINRFKALFDRGPMKSYPLYAGVGYDMARYFIPQIAATGGDFNKAGESGSTVVCDITLDRLSNWSGFYNPTAYMLKYSSALPVEIIKL